MRIGVDVGGTNTDAVLMDGLEVLAATKTATTTDIASGVVTAIGKILGDAATESSRIKAVMVGTTQFVNAVLQRKDLVPVAVVRVALPMTLGIPPLVDWPSDLRRQIGEHFYLAGGGSYYTGLDYTRFDADSVKAAAREIRREGIRNVAISAVFSPIRPDLEIRAAEIVREVAGNVDITMSHEVGGIGLIERENAAVLNAALQGLSAEVVSSLRLAMEDLNIVAPLFISQNDGTLMNHEYAERFPVLTSSAGPTNSIRGAAFLSGRKEGIVVDIGGTTTDVGVLLNGFPRETSAASELGGVRTNFSMPDVLSVALGGGTVVRFAEDGGVTLGPDSVGFRLLEEGQAFGGTTLTTSDIAIATGQFQLGDATQIEPLTENQLRAARAAIRSTIEAAIDRLKTSAAPVPVLLVGGGSVLVDGQLQGASEVITIDHAAVANAVGAAIAQVGGRVRRIFDFGGPGGREAALKEAIAEARNHAVAAGAVADTVEVVEIEEFPMTHMQTRAVDVRVRVVGKLALEGGGA